MPKPTDASYNNNTLAWFLSLDQSIRIKFTVEHTESTNTGKATFAHEYMHLLQAVTTAVGEYIFHGQLERYRRMIIALKNKSSRGVLYTSWPESDADDATRSFESYENDFNTQRNVLMGVLGRRLQESDSPDGDIVKTSFDVPGHDAAVIPNIVRVSSGRRVLLPLMLKAVAEAHAEAGASIITGIDSGLWVDDPNCDEELLYYSSIPLLVARVLPRYPLAECVALLCDFAMMSYNPGVVFMRALEVLRGYRGSWSLTRARCYLHKKLPKSVEIDLAMKDVESDLLNWSRLKGGLGEAVLGKLEQTRTALAMRKKDPNIFIPKSKTVSGQNPDEQGRLTSLVPAPYVLCDDGVRFYGDVTQEDQQHQMIIVGLSHLMLMVTDDGHDSRCPLYNLGRHCVSERVYECAVSPWLRGDTGEGKTCGFGLAGVMLGVTG